MSHTFALGIGGAAGQGVATPGDIFALILSRRGLHVNAYNAYQSIIRGGHTFLTIRTGVDKGENLGDGIDLLLPLNQDTMDRHLRLLKAGGACIYNLPVPYWYRAVLTRLDSNFDQAAAPVDM